MNERSINSTKSPIRLGQISIENRSSKNALSSNRMKRAKAVLQGISSTARKLKQSFRQRIVHKPMVHSLQRRVETFRPPKPPDDARSIDDRRTNISKKQVPHQEISKKEMRSTWTRASREKTMLPPELSNSSTLSAPYKSESVSDRGRNKSLSETSKRDNHFRSASMTSNQLSDDQIFQNSGLERQGNRSWCSIFSIESSISIRYRSQDG